MSAYIGSKYFVKGLISIYDVSRKLGSVHICLQQDFIDRGSLCVTDLSSWSIEFSSSTTGRAKSQCANVGYL